jgi:hypothetical protein
MAQVFVSVTGIGFVLCLGTGMICAASGGPGRARPTLFDPFNIKSHWRGLVTLGGVLMVVGLLGQWIAHAV